MSPFVIRLMDRGWYWSPEGELCPPLPSPRLNVYRDAIGHRYSQRPPEDPEGAEEGDSWLETQRQALEALYGALS
jgi:hypothetical protein